MKTRLLALSVLVACGLGVAAIAHAEDRKEIAQKLGDARAAIERIANQESDVGFEIEAAEKNLAEADAAAKAAAAELEAARAALGSAQAAETDCKSQLEARQKALGPRLFARYRAMRQGGAGALLLSESPASWMRMQRAFDRILGADLAALRDVRTAADLLANARAAAEKAEAEVAQRSDEAAAKRADAEVAAEGRRQLLAALRDEKRVQQQLIRELTRAQHQLDAQVSSLQRGPPAPTTGFAALKGKLRRPVEGGVIEVPFGKVVNARFNTVTFQNGVDIRVHEGAEVHAVGVGKVVFAGWFKGYGNLVIVDHGDNWHTLYAHLAATAKGVGETVQAGDLVGLVGDTGSIKGAYLYFEIRGAGKPTDPMPWFGR